MRRFNFGMVMAGILGCALLTGCIHSRVTDGWGYAQRENTARMIANPNAGADQTAAAVDGETANQSVKSYRESQAEARDQRQLPSIINLGIGTD